MASNMETGAWYTRTVEGRYEDVFYEVRELLNQRGWIVESYQNASEILAESASIIPQGLDSATNVEVIIAHPDEYELPTTTEADVAIPIIITDVESGSIIATVGMDTFRALYQSQSTQDTQLLWEELTSIIDDAADGVAG